MRLLGKFHVRGVLDRKVNKINNPEDSHSNEQKAP